MKYTAVIFDLFGTLVDSFSLQEYEHTLTQMASALSVSFKKPDPRIYQLACERLKVKSQNCLYIFEFYSNGQGNFT